MELTAVLCVDRERFATILDRLAVPPAGPDDDVLADVFEALELWDRLFARATSGEAPLDVYEVNSLAHALAHLHRVGRAAEGRPLPPETVH